jgi:hypothetical protein
LIGLHFTGKRSSTNSCLLYSIHNPFQSPRVLPLPPIDGHAMPTRSCAACSLVA